jgi:RNA polymerase sigma-54 factor
MRLGQHLTMTPQLQQAIRLLQLSSMELQTEIQQALESNPMLDNGEDTPPSDENQDQAATTENTNDAGASESGTESSRDNDIDMQTSAEIPDELPVDSAWEDIYENVQNYSSAAPDSSDREFDIQDTRNENIQDHLMWQISMLPINSTDMTIAETLIDSIDDDGYLHTPLDELCQSLNEQRVNGEAIEIDEIEAVLSLIQNLDPAGIAARNLQECLLLQLKQYPSATPWLNEAINLVSHYMSLLGNHDYAQLMRKLKISEDNLREVIKLIQSMNPRPGSQLSNKRVEYIVPDVYVKKVKGTWKVELNPDTAPRLKINPYYASLIKRADNSNDNVYLKNQLQEARWFLKSLQSRNETLLKVASSIVKYQQGFLEHGDEAMKALVLHDIAEEVDMHESTISRVTTRKYMHTPRGIYELKYFFSSHVSTATGGEASSTAIRAVIKKLIESENSMKPLSDSKIADILKEKGINVARRTVAKYREAMKIPPSNERKRLV